MMRNISVDEKMDVSHSEWLDELSLPHKLIHLSDVSFCMEMLEDVLYIRP